MKKAIHTLYLSLALASALCGQIQTSNILATLNNLGNGEVEVIFTPQVTLSGTGNPLNVYVKIPLGQNAGNTLTVNTNPFGLSFIQEYDAGPYHFYYFQGQPAVNLSSWTVSIPVSIIRLQFANQPDLISLSGGDFGGAIFTGNGWYWPGTSIATNNTVTNLVDWPIEASVLLPVELLTFAARPLNATDAALEWETASEQNSSHFEVERSVDGKGWQQIGRVDAEGFSQQRRSYNLVDKKVFDPSESPRAIYYYRLKMVDMDGSLEYSEVRQVGFEGGSGLFVGELYPNPVGWGAPGSWLPVYATEHMQVEMTVTDGLGRVVSYEWKGIEPGQQDLHIELRQFPAGVYLVECRANREKLAVKKLVVN